MGTLRQEQSEEFVAVAAFECRGLQPVVWHPSTDFIAESIGGRGFGVVSLVAKKEGAKLYCGSSLRSFSRSCCRVTSFIFHLFYLFCSDDARLLIYLFQNR
ncbi:unnamed protein product [Phaeothamnion confervicola]